MLSKRIIASDITNLTDARYFAAQGAEFLLFQMDKISISDVIEIKEWVEGLKILLSFNNDSISFLEESLLRIVPEGIAWKGKKVNNEFDLFSPYSSVFEFTEKGLLLDNIEYYQLKETIEEAPNYHGYIISGSFEELTGVKNFDRLNAFFESLEKPQ